MSVPAGMLGGCSSALHPAARFNYATTGSGLASDRPAGDQIPGGARVRASCSKCGANQTGQAGAHATSVALRRFAGVTCPGSQLDIAVTKGPAHGKGPKPQRYKIGAIGGYLTYTEKAGKLVFSRLSLP